MSRALDSQTSVKPESGIAKGVHIVPADEVITAPALALPVMREIKAPVEQIAHSTKPEEKHSSAVRSGPSLEPVNITWEEAAGKPEVHVHLDHLPDGLAFSSGFPEPIHFDAERKLLLYRGFMTSMSCQYLRSLTKDLTFLMALDQLNVKTSLVLGGVAATDLRPRSRRIVLWIAVGAGSVAAGVLLVVGHFKHWLP